MSEEVLLRLYEDHKGKGSDKWSIYLREYDRLFRPYRERPITLLEIGIQNGGSLEIWSKFFSNASALVGCDVNSDCARLKYEDGRISVVIGDANSEEVHKAILANTPAFDIILDDGSHCSSDIVKSFARYFPRLADDGIFVVEDLHCSYWREFEGGLFDPFSSIAFFKRLADIINYEHWGVDKQPSDILRGFFLKYGIQIDQKTLIQIHSVEFINSMCVIRKQAPEKNLLGKRVFTGANKSVVSHSDAGQVQKWVPPNQAENSWTAWETPPDEQATRLLTILAERDAEIKALQLSMAGQSKQMNELAFEKNALLAERDAILSSTSWRITKPVRMILHKIKRALRMTRI